MKPARSSVNFVVLVLLCEKPSYAYEVATRFVARYGDFFRSRHQNIYTAFDRLGAQGLIEPVPVDTLESRPRSSERQPKVIYRVTAKGEELVRAWLRSPLPIRDARREVLIRMRSLDPHDCDGTLRLLERLEETIPSDPASGPSESRPPRGIVEELLREREELGIEELRRWIAAAREKVLHQVSLHASESTAGTTMA